MPTSTSGLTYEDFSAKVKQYSAYNLAGKTEQELQSRGVPAALAREFLALRGPDGFVKPTDQNVERLWNAFSGPSRKAAAQHPARGPQLDAPEGQHGVNTRSVNLDARTARAYEAFLLVLKETD